MLFDTILGQETAVQTLQRALQAGRVHHAYRFEGPEGVGKELTAFALAEALICGPAAEPTLDGCRRRVHTLCDDEPHVPLHPDELTVQAANALLKTLEEPPPATYFVLLTSRPKRLLATVLSRSVPVRFARLPGPVIATLLERHGAPTSLAAHAHGSISRALALANTDSMRAHDEFVHSVLRAVSAPALATAITMIDLRASDRQGLREKLSQLAEHFAAQGRQRVAADPPEAQRAAACHQAVLVGLRQLERNVAPALVVESMVARLRRA
jgi:DNA polymerase-3 subunit delta'